MGPEWSSCFMYCQHCGSPISEGFTFCPQCGGKRQGASSSQQQPLHFSLSTAIKEKWVWNALTIAAVVLGTLLLWAHYKGSIGASDPSMADVRKVFENQWETQLKDGLAEILTFKNVASG